MSVKQLVQRTKVRIVQTQERRVAGEIGGKPQPGSGNKWYAKGDAKGPDLLVECKSTDKESISIKLGVIDKIEREAMLAGREPVLQIDFTGGRKPRSYALVTADRLMELLELEKASKR